MTSATPGLRHLGRKEQKQRINIPQAQSLLQALGWPLYLARGQNSGEDGWQGSGDGGWVRTEEGPSLPFRCTPRTGSSLQTNAYRLDRGKNCSTVENEGCQRLP